MFCPKCGTQNPETGKFCRSCGTDLGNVSEALSGKPKQPEFYVDRRGRVKSNDPNELWASGIKSVIMGIGFLVVSIVLLETGIAGGHSWWWAMLFPAFSMLAAGISQMARVKRMTKQSADASPIQQNQFASGQTHTALPSTQTDYIAPESRYKTGDLVPPSVIEGTTRHLEINNEGETMTLPKK